MKKFFFVFVFSSLLFSLNEVRAYTSSDVSNASFLATEGIIVKQSTTAGYRLDNTITRAEVIGMALKIKGITLPSNYTCKNYFIDAPYNPNNNWICRAVELGADDGIISRANTKARPQDSITRAEALAIVARDIENEPNSYSDPTKYIDANSWQIEVIRKTMAQGIINPKIVLGKDMGGLYSGFQERSVYFYPNRLATRAEVFGFATSIISAEGPNSQSYFDISTYPADSKKESLGENRHLISFGDIVTVDGEGGSSNVSECRVIAEPLDNMLDDIFGNIGEIFGVKRQNNIPSIRVDLELSGNPFEVIVGKQYAYSLYDHSPKHTCLDQVAINNLDTHVEKLAFVVYYHYLNNGRIYYAYLMRSPTGVSLETFESWYKNTTAVVFRADTLKDLGDNTYEFLVDMTENGVKTTYKVKSKVDLANYKINNISSVKQ